jgi:hypothetical protein
MPIVPEPGLDHHLVRGLRVFIVIAIRIRARIRKITADIIDAGNNPLIVKYKIGSGEFVKWIEP